MDLFKKFLPLLMISTIICFAHAVQADEKLEKLNELIKNKQHTEAYAYAEDIEADYAGEAEYDLLFGVAALDAGHADQAVFALERVLLTHPDNLRARLELGRAHFAMKDYPAARAEFNQVLEADIPPNVRANVRKFIALMDHEQRGGDKSDFHLYAGISGGVDSNVNSATTDAIVSVPTLGIVQLDPDSTGKSDEFIEVEVGASGTKPLKHSRAIYGRASVKNRENITDDEFDTNTLDVLGGFATRQGSVTVRFPVKYQLLQLDGDNYRYVISGGVDATKDLNETTQLGFFSDGSIFRYPGTTSLNQNQFLIGGVVTKKNQQDTIQVLFRPYYAMEGSRAGGLDSNARSFYGAQAAAFYKPKENHTAYVSLTGLHSDYNAVDPVFTVTREDDLYYAKVGWNWQAKKKIQLFAHFSYTKNDSNIELRKFTRELLTIGTKVTVV